MPGGNCRDVAVKEAAFKQLKDETLGLNREKRRLLKELRSSQEAAATLRPALSQARERCSQVRFWLCILVPSS